MELIEKDPVALTKITIAEYARLGGLEGAEVIMWLIMRVALSAIVRKVHQTYYLPTWSNPPRLIGDLNTPAGDNSQFFSPTTGFPAINVPMGFTRGGTLPAGMTVYGRAWSEATLVGVCV